MAKEVINKVSLLDIDEDGKILMTRSRGKDKWYVPGGKPEQPDADEQATLKREISEELGGVAIDPESLRFYDTFEAQAHGKNEGVLVRIQGYLGKCVGDIRPSNEIAEVARFSYADKDKGAPIDQKIFDRLHEEGLLK